ncbi:origin recognition complex subunit 3 isoform X2 [Latimeria chalumnae]|uniref:Origin recognition complex subunit 3 n=1 Tax=Latimeria chalumnae TaxID=7897 RepID=H3AGU0_LATCH|nr:PREDICTED: origin recognition complex subunit 3 [Latimeria chalumnae]|eukprot:XP_006010257.1 PREDICTED: origin recognition complex subunit 3 [Latimeria chalumnae]
MSMATSSVSKGCFVFKPSSKKKKTILTAADYFSEGQKDSEKSKTRFETCQLLWQQMTSETEKLQGDLNKTVFDSLLSFIRNVSSDFQAKTDDWSCRMRSSEIPTAVLVLGVNVPDHDKTFQSLSELLQESVTPYVVFFQAKECKDLKQVLQKLLVSFLNCEAELEFDEEESTKHHSSGISQWKLHTSMASLCGWYTSVTKNFSPGTQSKKRKSSAANCQNPPVVVIFEDLESFSPKVLQDFVVVCSQYIQKLPLVLIFGIATSPITIHRMLPHSVTSLLCLELFQSVPCTQHLATVIDKLVLTAQFPFRLNGKVLQVLLSIFLYHDFSVRNFIKGIELSMTEHFYSQPLSVLCCDLDETPERVKALTHEECEMVRQLPSFMRYVESQDAEKQVELLTSDEYLGEIILILVQDLHSYHKNYFPVLRCLHALMSSLPKYPLGKQIRELHCTCLEENVWELEEYGSAFQLLRMLAKDELTAVLQKCIDILKSSNVKCLTKSVKPLEEFVSRLQKFNEVAMEAEDETCPQKALQKKTNLYQLQKTLLELKDSRRSKKLNKFEVLRLEAVDYFDSIIRKYLLPPETQPLHEVFYFSAASTLRKHLCSTPRTALQTALSNPYRYLQNEALQSEEGAISNTAPDICIAYKLHLECGRLINLYDWLQAFVTVVAGAEGKDPDSAATAQVDETIHARFIRAVSELEFLGLVKPSKQKTDHVTRLTWGGC